MNEEKRWDRIVDCSKAITSYYIQERKLHDHYEQLHITLMNEEDKLRRVIIDERKRVLSKFAFEYLESQKDGANNNLYFNNNNSTLNQEQRIEQFVQSILESGSFEEFQKKYKPSNQIIQDISSSLNNNGNLSTPTLYIQFQSHLDFVNNFQQFIQTLFDVDIVTPPTSPTVITPQSTIKVSSTTPTTTTNTITTTTTTTTTSSKISSSSSSSSTNKPIQSNYLSAISKKESEKILPPPSSFPMSPTIKQIVNDDNNSSVKSKRNQWQQRVEQENQEKEKKLERDRIERIRLEKERTDAAVRNRVEISRKQEQEKKEKELEKERLEKEKKDKLEKDRLERIKFEKERLERERLIEKEKKDKLEKDRLERIKFERERNERDRLEALKKIELLNIENERLEKEKKDKLEKERLQRNERDRLEALKKIELLNAEKEKVERLLEEKRRDEKFRNEKLLEQQKEKERLEQSKADRLEKEKQDIIKFEKERLERDRLERERKEKEWNENVKLKEEKERIEKERLDRERKELLLSTTNNNNNITKTFKESVESQLKLQLERGPNNNPYDSRDVQQQSTSVESQSPDDYLSPNSTLLRGLTVDRARVPSSTRKRPVSRYIKPSVALDPTVQVNSSSWIIHDNNNNNVDDNNLQVLSNDQTSIKDRMIKRMGVTGGAGVLFGALAAEAQMKKLENDKNKDIKSKHKSMFLSPSTSSELLNESTSSTNQQTGGNRLSSNDKSYPIIPFDQLMKKNTLSIEVDRSVLEKYLSDEEFKMVLGMSRDDWNLLPTWKKSDKKKIARLF